MEKIDKTSAMTEINNLKELIFQNANKLVLSIWDDLKLVNIETVEQSDGRRKDCHETSQKGSFVYLFYGYNDDLLYVGETGVSIKSRLTGDGNGAHNKKDWYQEISYIKYYRQNNSDLTETERKIIEESITLVKKPLHYR